MFCATRNEVALTKKRFEAKTQDDFTAGMYTIATKLNKFADFAMFDSSHNNDGIRMTFFVENAKGEEIVKGIYRKWAQLLASSMPTGGVKRKMYATTQIAVRQMRHPYAEGRDVPVWVWEISTGYEPRTNVGTVYELLKTAIEYVEKHH